MKRAYTIYECEHGWCMCRADHPSLYNRESQHQWAFSRLSQLTWFLLRMMKQEETGK